MKKFKSKNAAQKYLDDNHTSKVRYCPLTKSNCTASICASWEDAIVIQHNFPLNAEKVIWKIKPGYCRNPLITGVIEIIK